ncbi:MAG: PPC domain-containing protein [Planctomycetales bacterium]|nr:PPC domain-containing protein [Planctomycetales bacterium]
MSRLVAVTFCLAFLTLAPSARAEPFVEHVEPPSVCRGQQNQIVLVGRDVDRAIGIWTSLPAEKFKVAAVTGSEKERSEFKIDVAADCPLGIYGLRLATEDGLSNLHLFVVDDLAPRTSLADPQMEFPVAVAGQLRPAAVDRHRIQVSAGQRLSLDVIASRLGNDADPLVTIFDPAGRRIAQRDNDPGLFFDCSWEQTFELAGIYTVEVRDSRYLGSPHWRYLLRMGSFPAARVAIPSAVRPGETTLLKLPELPGTQISLDVPATQRLGGFFHSVRRSGEKASSWIPLLGTSLPSVLEVEPNETVEQATPTSAVPVILHGNFEQPGDKDYFQLNLTKGQRLMVRAETKPLNSPADVELSIVDAMGREIQRVDDVALPGGALDEGSLTFNVGQDGKYYVLVCELTRAAGSDFSYRITVQPAAPRFEILAEASALTIPQDSYQSLPLTVTRYEYTGPIELSLVGAPAGFKLEPSIIPEGESGILCKLSAAGTVPLGLYQLELIGKGKAGDMVITTPVTTQPLVDRQLVNVDLIKHALRDNQRWLPPSVTDKLAVQITPPTPFTVELASNNFTLPRYQHADVPIQVGRIVGFDGAIDFLATGTQQLGQESQGRRQVFARFPTATPDKAAITGTIHSRSQANEGTERVDIRATARQGTRWIQLDRSIMLAIKPAFEIEVEPAKLTLAPGDKRTVKLVAMRLLSFAGAVTIIPSSPPGITLPASITIPADKPSVEIEIAIPSSMKPNRERIRFLATAPVNGFQEEPRAKELEIEIKEPTPATTATK